jgi:hypothetical protein
VFPVTIRPLMAFDLDRNKEIDRAAFSSEDAYDAGVYPLMLQSGESVAAIYDRLIDGFVRVFEIAFNEPTRCVLESAPT